MSNLKAGISVVIPHYGDPLVPLAVVQQLREQEGAPSFEIIVVDDCSPIELPSIEGALVTRTTVNKGFGGAVNAGALLAEHELLLVLNSDVALTPSFLRDFYRDALPLMPCVASPNVVDAHGAAQFTARRFPRIWHHLVVALTPLARFRQHDWWHRAVGHDLSAAPGEIQRVDWVVGAVMLLPLAEFRAVHGLDEGYHMNSEEIDLQLRLLKRGVPSYLVGTVDVEHVGGGSSASDLRRRWVVAASYRYTQKWTNAIVLHRAALALAACLNFTANCLRRATGSPVRPLAVARSEFELVVLPPANGAPRA